MSRLLEALQRAASAGAAPSTDGLAAAGDAFEAESPATTPAPPAASAPTPLSSPGERDKTLVRAESRTGSHAAGDRRVTDWEHHRPAKTKGTAPTGQLAVFR